MKRSKGSQPPAPETALRITSARGLDTLSGSLAALIAAL
jgi:hypothetical protein